MTGAERRLLEVCVDCAAGLAAATRGGADRIELCAALSSGGLTPAASLVRLAADGPLPVHLLARPRDGDFVYTPTERGLVADDIRTAADAGLAGVAIGASRHDRTLDQDLLAAWIAYARMLGTRRGTPLSLTLHRAFDLVPDPERALDAAIALGFDRILTSGGQPRAIDGAAMLERLHTRAAGRIVILAASGIDAACLPAILATGIYEVHASCRASVPVAVDTPERRFGFVGAERAETDADRVRRLKAALGAAEDARG